jgi:hypothetical protein
MTVSYTEIAGSPRNESATDNEFTATRELKLAWSDRGTFIGEILGTAYPTVSAAKAVRVAFQPFGGETGASETVAAYDHALATVEYSTNAIVDNISESIEPSAEFITLPAENFRWDAADGDELTDDEAPGKLIRKLDYVLTRHNVTTVPSDVLSLVGYVNNAAVSPTTSGISAWSFAAETLLYTPPTMSRTIDSAGASKWKVTLRFSYQPWTWNKFWRADTQAWSEIYVAGGAVYKNYPSGNFSTLLGT